MIGKFVVIDTLNNFKSKLDSIPSSAIVLIKDVGQIYAHGTYFGAQKTYELLNLNAAGLAPAGGINANGLISNVDSEWVLTVTEGKDPAWKKLPANAFSNDTFELEAATTSNLGGIKVGSVYNGLFSTLTGKHYTVNVDKAGLAYVSVPWDFTDLNVKQTSTSLLDADFSLLFSHTADDETHTEGTRKASNLKFNPSTGTLTTTILKGNLDGSYINKLTGYSKAKSVAAITASDTLKTALGKLEKKADVVYDLVAAANPDSTTIDTLQEVLSVLSGITDTLTVQGILGNYLPLSGGTLTSTNYAVLNIKRDTTANVGIAINFLNNNGDACDLMADPVTHCLKRGYDVKTYQIWDEGNDGANSGLDADLLDGNEGEDYFRFFRGSINNANIDTYTTRYNGSYTINHNGYSSGLFVFKNNGSLTSLEIYAPHYDIKTSPKLRYSIDNNRYGDWRTLAFEDSNVASATKLKTSRTIWGQSFNGSANISGAISNTGAISPSKDSTYDIGSASNQYRYIYASWFGAKTGETLSLGANNANHIKIDTSGNVGIGTLSPTTKLEVNGTVKATTFDGTASKVSVGTGTGNSYRAIVVTNGSDGLYTAGTDTGKPQYNYSTGDIKAKSFTTDGGDFNGNATSASDADKIDGYHISVTSSPGNDTSTIYFVT